MDTSLVDLDVLLTRVRDPRSRGYVLDAIRAYRAGAMRPAVTAVWVAVAFDFLTKYRELASRGDAEAASFVAAWDTARTNSNSAKLVKLERELLTHAAGKLQLLEPLGLRDMNRLRDDRHLCAHPAFSTDAELFEPSAELVRLHIVNAVGLVLSQRPVQGRSILHEFSQDLLSPGFPSDPTKIADHIEQRYLSRSRTSTVRNLGSVLAKSLLRNEPAEWEPVKDKTTHCLSSLRDRRPDEWAPIETEIVRLIDELDPALRLNALPVLAMLPSILNRLETTTVAALQQSIVNFDPVEWSDLTFFRAVALDYFRVELLNLLRDTGAPDCSDVLRVAPMKEFWPVALEKYSRARNWRGAEEHFRELIEPFEEIVARDNLDNLLQVIPENSQIFDASGMAGLLFEFLEGAATHAKPSMEARTNFYEALAKLGDWVLPQYEAIWPVWAADGWEAPCLDGG